MVAHSAVHILCNCAITCSTCSKLCSLNLLRSQIARVTTLAAHRFGKSGVKSFTSGIVCALHAPGVTRRRKDVTLKSRAATNLSSWAPSPVTRTESAHSSGDMARKCGRGRQIRAGLKNDSFVPGVDKGGNSKQVSLFEESGFERRRKKEEEEARVGEGELLSPLFFFFFFEPSARRLCSWQKRCRLPD